MKKLTFILALAFITSNAFAACPNLEGEYHCSGAELNLIVEQEAMPMEHDKDVIHYRLSAGADAQNLYSDNQIRPFKHLTAQTSCTAKNELKTIRRMWGTVRATVKYSLDEQGNLINSMTYIGVLPLSETCKRVR